MDERLMAVSQRNDFEKVLILPNSSAHCVVRTGCCGQLALGKSITAVLHKLERAGVKQACCSYS